MYSIGYIVDDDESLSEDETDIALLPGVSGDEAQEREDETRRIAARARPNTQSAYITADEMALPFRVPRESEPSIWSVRVKVSDFVLS